ncbi:MAG: hypothetical protein NTU53_15710 [Planctomycetota bacterium]|nr:hypothetical protein [Planctomycetota bacterium]
MSDSRFSISDCRIELRQRWSGRRRGGFTFTEVLFAVMLLGIGFIMVAAIFPVAIQQSQANREDAMGVILAKQGARIMESLQFNADDLGKKLPNNMLLRYDGRVHMFGLEDNNFGGFTWLEARFKKLLGNLVDRTDARYAWVPLGYKLGPWPTAVPPNVRTPVFYEVYLVGVACRNKSAYEEGKDMDLQKSWTFQPKVCSFFLTEGNTEADTITFTRGLNSLEPGDYVFAAEGAYVLVANDQLPNADPRRGRANGRMYRLGVRRTDKGPGCWELVPGKDMSYGPLPDGTYNASVNENLPPRDVGDNKPKGSPAKGYMIGRAYVDPWDPKSGADGPAQDLFATSVVIYFPMQ